MAMTEIEIQDEIDEITAALSFIRKGGQSYTIKTSSSERVVSQADYDTLRTERLSLYAQLEEINGTAGLQLGAGW